MAAKQKTEPEIQNGAQPTVPTFSLDLTADEIKLTFMFLSNPHPEQVLSSAVAKFVGAQLQAKLEQHPALQEPGQ